MGIIVIPLIPDGGGLFHLPEIKLLILGVMEGMLIRRNLLLGEIQMMSQSSALTDEATYSATAATTPSISLKQTGSYLLPPPDPPSLTLPPFKHHHLCDGAAVTVHYRRWRS